MSMETRKLSKLPSFYPCNIEKRGKKTLATTLDEGGYGNRVEWGKRRTKKIFRSFPCCPKPLFQSEAKCETIDMKMSFILIEMNSFSQEMFCT